MPLPSWFDFSRKLHIKLMIYKSGTRILPHKNFQFVKNTLPPGICGHNIEGVTSDAIFVKRQCKNRLDSKITFRGV